MRFLIDASVSPAVAQALAEAGHDAVHVGAALRLDAPDDEVFANALSEGRVLVTGDTDFGDLLAQRGTAKPSLILFRRGTRRRPTEQAAMIVAHLSDVEQDLRGGAIVVMEEHRIRVRPLPLAED